MIIGVSLDSNPNGAILFIISYSESAHLKEATAKAAQPSHLPTGPSLSLVVALIEIFEVGSPRLSEMFFRIAGI